MNKVAVLLCENKKSDELQIILSRETDWMELWKINNIQMRCVSLKFSQQIKQMKTKNVFFVENLVKQV